MRSKTDGVSHSLSNKIKYMGLNNDRSTGKFINILGGRFAVRVPEGTEGAVSRVNKEGNTVFEKYYNSFTGRLVDIKVQDSAYGKNWIFSFQDAGEIYNLQLSLSNSFATHFLKILPNADLEKEMKVQPAIKLVDGKSKSSLFVSQEGKTLKHAFTMENPNGLPDMKKIVVKGQEVWDDTERIEFLHKMVVETILPKLPKIESNNETSHSDSGLAVEETVSGYDAITADSEDDQPF